MADEIVTQWKLIPDTDGIYEASENGEIRSKDRIISIKSRHGSCMDMKRKGRLLKPWHDSNGYLVVYICANNKRQAINVHRLVANAFHGLTDVRMDVNHKDGNKENNHFLNLEWASRKENMKHARETGLWDPNGKRINSNAARKKKITGTPINGGDVINFESVADAGRYLGKAHGNIGSAANGILKQAYGYYWSY